MNAVSTAVHGEAQQAVRSLVAEYYRPEVDGLRGVAVLVVLGFHAFPDYFSGGFVGVDVFFVVSGFLISSIILRQLRRSTFTFSGFYARRIRRIFPALITVLVPCLLFGCFALLPDELEELGKHVGAAAAFVSNFVLWQESGYFDRAAEFKPLLHLWSLGIEEQFYLMWPMLLLLALEEAAEHRHRYFGADFDVFRAGYRRRSGATDCELLFPVLSLLGTGYRVFAGDGQGITGALQALVQPNRFSRPPKALAGFRCAFRASHRGVRSHPGGNFPV